MSSIEHLEIPRTDEEKLAKIEKIQDLSTFLRRDALEVIREANNGHIGGSLSSVELLTALYFGGKFHFDPDDPNNPNRDKILIRGHEGPIRYPIFSLFGYIDRQELSTYRRLGSRLQGHEDMHYTPGVDITPSGSLGMLLSYGVGAAVAAQQQGNDHRTIVFLGDGEEQEGNVSEAARHAANIGLDNLICILDQNGKQLSRPTAYSDGNTDLEAVWKGYGWDVLAIQDGHNVEEILDVYDDLQHITKPTMVIAHTIKGKGVPKSEEHFSGYHTLSAVPDKSLVDQAIETLDEQITTRSLTLTAMRELALSTVARPIATQERVVPEVTGRNPFAVSYQDLGKRNLEDGQTQFFGELEKSLSERTHSDFYLLTPDLLRTDVVKEIGINRFGRFIDTGIREQHAIGLAHGISVEDPDARVYVCYGDAFAYRAMDQMNAAAQGRSNILIAAENAGIFQGQNGKTHQSIGQSAALLRIPEMNVYEPGDIRDLFNVFSKTLTDNNGVTYVRLHRAAVSFDRDATDNDNIDAYYIHRPDVAPKFTLVTSGFTAENSVQAAQKMELEDGIPTAVINVVNQGTLQQSLPRLLDDDTPMLTVYNGHPNTLQSMVSAAVMENPDMPRPQYVAGHGFIEGTSGSVAELTQYYKFDANGIRDVALSAMSRYRR